MLSAYLVPFERAFCFQVTEQSSELYRALKTQDSFVASNGWTIMKASSPEVNLRDKVIYLRGDDGDRNLRVSRTWDLSSNNARDKYLSQINSALQEFVNFVTAPSHYANVPPQWSSAEYWSIWGRSDIMSNSSLGKVKAPKSNTVSSKPIITA